MTLTALTRAMHDAGLRPRRIGNLDAWQASCPACYHSRGGKDLLVFGDPWPDALCVNPSCPTNRDPALQRVQLHDDIRLTVHGHTPPIRGAWLHLGRTLGPETLARLLRPTKPERATPQRRYQPARPAPRPARTLHP